MYTRGTENHCRPLSTGLIPRSHPMPDTKLRGTLLLCQSSSWTQLSEPHGLQPARLLHPWDSPGKSTGVGCHFLLQGILPTQGWKPGLPHGRQTLYHLSHHSASRAIQGGTNFSVTFFWCPGQTLPKGLGKCDLLRRR